jgi:hypothetical protein
MFTTNEIPQFSRSVYRIGCTELAQRTRSFRQCRSSCLFGVPNWAAECPEEAVVERRLEWDQALPIDSAACAAFQPLRAVEQTCRWRRSKSSPSPLCHVSACSKHLSFTHFPSLSLEKTKSHDEFRTAVPRIKSAARSAIIIVAAFV